MKNILKTVFLFVILATLTLAAACNTPSGNSNGAESKPESEGPSSESVLESESESESISPKVEITAIQPQITISDEEYEILDLNDLFAVTVDDVVIEDGATFSVTEVEEGGVRVITVTCSYLSKSAEVKITVTQTVYEVSLSKESVTVIASEVDSYDFLALFTATRNGEPFEITQEMVQTDLEAKKGEYFITVTVKGESKTLSVTVIDHLVEVVNSYSVYEICIGDLENFDLTQLFSLYVDGVAERVTLDMIDASALENAQVGGEYEVKFSASVDSATANSTCKIKVKADQETVVTAKNVVTYPNGEYIDLTTLFEIVRGDEVIPVTADMVSGSVDYSKVGVNQITLTYNGEQTVATVEVKRGVVISYQNSSTVTVKKGTDKSSYPFANDFKVIVNGIRFTAIDGYIDASQVDFSTAGEYTATITVPYNDKALSLSGVNFTYFESSITYVVVENEYSISIKEDLVTLAKGTTEYNVFKNIKLTINGRNQSLTTVKEYEDPITCYAEILSDPIDFESSAIQRVVLAVYVYGSSNSPITVEFDVVIKSDIKVEGSGKVIFTGETVYTRDLFNITENGERVEVTNDMIIGKVDVFTPGLYTVVLNYKGFIAESKVTVVDNQIVGTYLTLLTTIDQMGTDDEGNDVVETAGRRLRNLFYYEDGRITVDGANATVTGVIDDSTRTLKLMNYDYTMYYNDGIIVLDPDNGIKLPFNDQKRPMVYFHNLKWNLISRLTVNSSSTYVLNASITCYSFDVFEIVDIESGETYHFALKVDMIDKANSDTVYKVEWGFVTLAEDFIPQAGVTSSLEFMGKTYKFTMDDSAHATMKKTTATKEYGGLKFDGVIDGENAILSSTSSEGWTLKVGSAIAFNLSMLDVENLAHGGSDYLNQTVFLYGHDEADDGIFSYKFHLDLTAKTFTVEEKDVYFGKYKTENAFIFLDGYGTGVVNFNTKSYYRYSFEYTVVGNRVEMEFFNVPYNFTHGEKMIAFIEPLLNVMTVNYAEDQNLVGAKFENVQMTDGAIVEIDSFKIGADSDKVAKQKFLDGIKIVTPSGELTGTEKTNAIDTSKIRFSVAGFYQFTITVTVNGEKVVSYYAVQVLDDIYLDNPMVASYGNGVIFATNGLVIDKYGQAIITVGERKFEGLAKIVDDTVAISAFDENGGEVKANGKIIKNGLISLVCTGAATFSDFFTTGVITYAGADGFELRIINLSGENVYITASSSTSVGNVATAEVISGNLLSVGSIMKFTANGEETFVKIDSLGEKGKGLTLADAYRGTYTVNGEDSQITFDGFGKFTGEGVGTYILFGRLATVTVNGENTVYRLDNNKMTAEKVDVAFDSTLVSGKVFSADHTFTCEGYPYTASTSFEFKANGVVIVKSTSSEHDIGGEYGDPCSNGDFYSPVFASADGVSGSYAVSGNKITVIVNGYTFVFEMQNVVAADSLKCISTTATSGEHGYFSVNTVFTV